jgi:hypothetical protein
MSRTVALLDAESLFFPAKVGLRKIGYSLSFVHMELVYRIWCIVYSVKKSPRLDTGVADPRQSAGLTGIGLFGM